MYAIAGVTGHVGSTAATTLLAQGQRVRVIVRDAAKGATWKEKGAEVAIADIADAAALTAALTGVDAAFLLLPPDVVTTRPLEQNVERTAAITAAVRASKVPHVVLLSSVGAQHPDGTGPIRSLHHAETALRATGVALTAVRAAYFQENWGSSLGAVPHGILPVFLPPALRFAQVATADIGRTVAAALVEGPPAAKFAAIELSGPREYTSAEVAAEVAALTGTAVAPAEQPLDQVVPTLTQFGISTENADLFREMYAGLISGRVGFEGSGRHVRGRVEVRDTLRNLLGRG